MTMATNANELRSRTCSSAQAASIASALALPANTVACWLRFGASGADSCTESALTSTAAICMARDSGIWPCRSRSSASHEIISCTADSWRLGEASLLLGGQHALDPPVRDQPQQRDQDINSLRYRR